MQKTKFIFLISVSFLVSGCIINPQISTTKQNSSTNNSSKKEIQECKNKGGEWKEFCKPGWGDGLCGFDCYISYEDTDKACGDSNECKSGYCIIDGEEMRKNYKKTDEIIKRIISQKEGHCHGTNQYPDCLRFIKNGEIHGSCS